MLDFGFAKIDEMAKELGSRLKTARLTKGIQQADLAARSGISRATLTNLENHGKCTLATVLQVARALRLEKELQNLFFQQAKSIAAMEVAAVIRKRAPNKPKKISQ